MTTEQAIERAIELFPFKGYINPQKRDVGTHADIANTVQRFLPPGGRVLDFGSGPCDKTAVLQFLGYQCTAYDDLQDDWHLLPGNREKILSFAKESGIDFRLADGSPMPFEKCSFDMIIINSVLEHLHDSPRDLMNDLTEFIKPRGLLFVTVPNAVNIRKRIDVLLGKTNMPRYEGYYWYPGVWRGHVREYVKDDLAKLAQFLNLETLEIRGCDHKLERLPAFTKSIYISLTKHFDGWKDSLSLMARKPDDWYARKSLSQDELARILGKSTAFDYNE